MNTVLFACGPRGSYPLLTFEGEPVKEEIEAIGTDLIDLLSDVKSLPLVPGLYVWQGELRRNHRDEAWMGGGEHYEDYDVTWDGTWRKATLADLERFGWQLEAGEVSR